MSRSRSRNEEAYRLQELENYDVPDTPADRGITAFTTLATRLTNTPIAVVSMVHADRESILAGAGIAQIELASVTSLAPWVVSTGEAVVTNDAASDARFRSAPCVTGPPGIRFFAGVPLITPAGYLLGSLSVIDTAPRPSGLTESQLHSLTVLGEQVVTVLDYRHQLRLLQQGAAVRRNADEDLEDREMRYRLLVEHATDIIYSTDAAGRFTFVNATAVEAMQYSREELLRFRFVDLIRPDARTAAERFYRKQFRDRTPSTYYEFPALRKDNSEIWFGQHVHILTEGDRINGFQAIARDITESKHNEEELREARQQTQALLEATNDIIQRVDPSGRFLYANKAWHDTLGYTVEEMEKLTIFDVIHPDSLEHCRALFPALMAGSEIDNIEFSFLAKDGQRVDVAGSASCEMRDGQPYATRTFLHDVTSRKQAEESLRNMNAELEKRVLSRTSELQAAYQKLNFHIENTPLGMIQWTPDLRILHWSGQARTIFGWNPEEVEGKGLDEWPFIHDRDRDAVREIMERLIGGRERRRVHRVHQIAKDGHEVQCVWHTSVMLSAQGQVMSMMALIQDLSEQVRLEQQFHQAQKMEAVGRLAGGIAHDFNNLLTVINGYSDMVLEDPTAPASVKRAVEQILYAGERASALTHQLLAFSRQQVLRPRRLHLNATLMEMEKLMRRLIGEDVELVLSLDARPDAIIADPGQIDQTVMNLAVNARDAMPSGGRLSLETRNFQLDRPLVSQHGSTLQPGAYILLTVSDTGVGIDDRTLGRIFEPFFTTKGPGKGTGLGLATVHGIMQQSGGMVSVSSRRGQGTAFKLYFPAAEVTAISSEPSRSPAPMQKGSETILLVEDEPIVRAFAREVLSSVGYTVLEVRTAEEAMFLSNGYEDRLHLLLTDVVLPAGRGTTLADELTRKRPDMMALLMSGYIDQNPTDTAIAERFPFLQKPFTREMLLAKVREVLDSAAPGINDAQLPLLF